MITWRNITNSAVFCPAFKTTEERKWENYRRKETETEVEIDTEKEINNGELTTPI